MQQWSLAQPRVPSSPIGWGSPTTLQWRAVAPSEFGVSWEKALLAHHADGAEAGHAWHRWPNSGRHYLKKILVQIRYKELEQRRVYKWGRTCSNSLQEQRLFLKLTYVQTSLISYHALSCAMREWQIHGAFLLLWITLTYMKY